MNVTEQIRKELLAEFHASTRERLDRVAAAWVALESDPVTATANGALVLRELHTLKGEAKLMGYGALSQVAHKLEDLVVLAERSGYRVGADLGDLVLRAVDVLGKLALGEAVEPDAAPAEVKYLEAKLVAAGVAPNVNVNVNVNVNDSGTGVTLAPPLGEPRPAPVAEAPGHGSPEPIERDTFVRIDAPTAHRIAEGAGDGVIAHARYRNALHQLRALCGELASIHGAPAAGLHARLAAVVDQLAADVADGAVASRTLELDARTLRLVPVAPLFRQHLRAVRELARELGKRASLQISDGGIAVDREVVERLGPPLLHLLRNCVDHGLEAPAARKAAGKLDIGRITLAAERSGADVLVIVEDDGAGVDADVVRARAVATGLVPVNAPLSDNEVLALLFAPGFSTRTEVTETSGRGVGLDVVKRQVESLGGAVAIASRPGKGTRFELRVPVTVALTRALIVEENRQVFAIPHASVEAVIAIEPAAVETLHARRYATYRGARIPLAELAAVLQIPATSIGSGDRELRAVVIHHEGQRIALLVDAWRGDAEIVIKPLDALAGSRAAIGACTLDGGALALVLSPLELVTRALGESPRIRVASATRANAPAAAQRRILLVEDSAITRTMIAQLLRMLGYHVAEAEDGAHGLRAIEESGGADAIITDLEMPEVDGIEMIRRLRADRRWRDVPVIVLSTRGSADDKQRATAAGANAYLVKTEFSEAALRDVLARHTTTGRA